MPAPSYLDCTYVIQDRGIKFIVFKQNFILNEFVLCGEYLYNFYSSSAATINEVVFVLLTKSVRIM